ncbi:MAG TPA: hypothetical protein VKT77_02140 [Chthonomonadaceae bacterium]|nr:hypothetical protein [Chthonomonadaceae bacterium]
MNVLIAAALLLAAIQPAHAYIDAGSGSYVIQIAMAGVLAALFSLKLSWRRLKTFASGILAEHRRSRASIGR